MTERKANVRAIVLEMLLQSQEPERQCHLLLRDALDTHSWLSVRDRAFLTRLFEGTIEYRIQLDFIIGQYAKTGTKKMRPVIREILRMGVYQIRYMESVPVSAAVNEAVKLARKRGFASLGGFVNGVLRHVAEHPEQVRWPEKNGRDILPYLRVTYAMPDFLLKKWLPVYGPEVTEEICKSFLAPRPLTVRLRGPREERDAFPGSLPEGCTAEPCDLIPDVWFVRGVKNPASLPGYSDGSFYIQDVSSMLAVMAAGIRAGDRVLDLCAAPGGKSILAADLMEETSLPGQEDRGLVISRDVTERKITLLEENRERCHVRRMEPSLWDATVYRPEDRGAWDVVIADVPCSGYGVIGRKPDIRFHASGERERSLAALQRKILTNAAAYVRPGGTLLFSTCTINRMENEENTRWLEEQFPLEKRAERQLLPGTCSGDGFYYAVLTRREEE